MAGIGDTKVIKLIDGLEGKMDIFQNNHFNSVGLLNSIYIWEGDEWLILWEEEDKSGLHRKS